MSADGEPVSAGQRTNAESRLVIAAIFLGTLALASGLLFVHVRSTEIAIDALVSAMSFVTPREQAVLRPMLVESMSAAGLSRGTGEAPGVVRLRAHGDGPRTGSISLDRIVVPAGTHVWLARTEVPRQYRLSLRSPRPVPVSVHADLMGTVEMRPSASRAIAGDPTAPRPIDLTSTTNDFDLDITLLAGAPPPRMRQLLAADLQLHEIEEELTSVRPDARPMSTIESGSLWFESIAGEQRTLRAGELIRLDSARGMLQSLTLGADGIGLRFHGTVRGVFTGYDDEPRSLMPTMLDTLRARQGGKLLWGTALYLFGAVMAVRRWWRKPS